MLHQSVSAIVLAGGFSQRMGTDKALLPIGGKVSLEVVVGKLRRVSDDICVVRRPDQPGIDLDGTRVEVDLHPGEGPLAGMESGLLCARHPWVICLPADAPCVRVELLQHLMRYIPTEQLEKDTTQAIIPVLGTQIYPLVAVYHTSVYSVLAKMLGEGKRRVRDLLPRIHVRFLQQSEWESFDPRHDSFQVMNTIADYERVLQQMSEGDVSHET